jgi:hypothetical protein
LIQLPETKFTLSKTAAYLFNPTEATGNLAIRLLSATGACGTPAGLSRRTGLLGLTAFVTGLTGAAETIDLTSGAVRVIDATLSLDPTGNEGVSDAGSDIANFLADFLISAGESDTSRATMSLRFSISRSSSCFLSLEFLILTSIDVKCCHPAQKSPESRIIKHVSISAMAFSLLFGPLL